MTTIINYFPKSINLDSYASVEGYTVPLHYNELGEKIANLMLRIAEDFHNKDLKHADEYKFNLFHELGIEEYSHLLFYQFKYMYEAILRTINLSPKSKLYFSNIDCYIVPSQLENFFAKINKYLGEEIPSKSDDYKIHLMVKADYIIYVFTKLLLFLRQYKYIINSLFFNVKFTIFSRGTFPNIPTEDGNSGNSLLLNDTGNGGSAATIVLYAGHDKRKLIDLIKYINYVFKDEIDLVGLMNDITNKPQLIPTFNVRLNSLVAYALGDRGEKLDTKLGIIRKPYKIPKWLTEKLSKCKDMPAEINKKSQSWFGTNICSDSGESLIGPDDNHFKYVGHPHIEMLSPDLLVDEVVGGKPNKKTNKKRKHKSNTKSKKTMKK